MVWRILIASLLLLQSQAFHVPDPSGCLDRDHIWATHNMDMTRDSSLSSCHMAVPLLPSFGMSCHTPVLENGGYQNTIADICTLSCTSCDTSCPENSSSHPDGAVGCICDPGYVGTLEWTGLRYDGDCQVVECPAHSSGSPACECEVGYLGELTFVRDFGGGYYVGQCTRISCDKGYRLEGGVCMRVECPSNSEGFPDCTCQDAFGGELLWVNDRYQGECAPCSAGYFSLSGQSDCQALNCPMHSSGFPACSCDPGFAGQIQWDSESRVFDGECEACEIGKAPSGETGECEDVSCPEFSSGNPDCTCNPGYIGYVLWSVDHYEGACVTPGSGCPHGTAMTGNDGFCSLLKCPPHSSGHPECTCSMGYSGEVLWSGIGYEGACSFQKCPPNSSGHPNCMCDKGFQGKVTWSTQYQQYEGSCKAVACPLHSRGSPDCKCDLGYVGSVWWRGDGFAGECTALACPENSQFHPNCECFEGYVGHPVWSYDRWNGTCMAIPSASPVPVYSFASSTPSASPSPSVSISPSNSPPPVRCDIGFTKSVDGSYCQAVDCPTHSTGHPHCQCHNGFAGHVGWTGSRYNGTCHPCGEGFRSVVSNSKCEYVACPLLSTPHPDCRCTGNAAGTIAWSAEDQMYFGSCTECNTGFAPDSNQAQCIAVECPENAVEHPTCACKYGYSGEISWNGQGFDGSCADIRPTELAGSLSMLDVVYSEEWEDINGAAFKHALGTVLRIDSSNITITAVEPAEDPLAAQALVQSESSHTMSGSANMGVIVHYVIEVTVLRDTVAPSVLVARLSAALATGALVHELDLMDIVALHVTQPEHIHATPPGDIAWQPMEPSLTEHTDPFAEFHQLAASLASALNSILDSNLTRTEKHELLVSTLVSANPKDETVRQLIHEMTMEELVGSIRRVIAALSTPEEDGNEETDGDISIRDEPQTTSPELSKITILAIRIAPNIHWADFNEELVRHAVADVLTLVPVGGVEITNVENPSSGDVRISFRLNMAMVTRAGNNIESTLNALNTHLHSANSLYVHLRDKSVDFLEVSTPLPNIEVVDGFNASVLRNPVDSVRNTVSSWASAAIRIPPLTKTLTAESVRRNLPDLTRVLVYLLDLDSHERLVITSVKPNVVVSFAVNVTGLRISDVEQALVAIVEQKLPSALSAVLKANIPYVTLAQTLTPEAVSYTPFSLPDLLAEDPNAYHSGIDEHGCNSYMLFQHCKWTEKCFQDFVGGVRYPCIAPWVPKLVGTYYVFPAPPDTEFPPSITISHVHGDTLTWRDNQNLTISCEMLVTENATHLSVSPDCPLHSTGFDAMTVQWRRSGANSTVGTLLGPQNVVYSRQIHYAVPVDHCADVRQWGYEWCPQQDKCVQDWAGGESGPCAPSPVGGYMDAHNCDGSLGYSWCAEKGMCVQNYLGGHDGPCPTELLEANNLDNPVTVCNVLSTGSTDCNDLYTRTLARLPGACNLTLAAVCMKIPATFHPADTIFDLCPQMCPSSQGVQHRSSHVAARLNLISESGTPQNTPPRVYDSPLCGGSESFTWCEEKSQCVQDWVGGINGPCTETEDAPLFVSSVFGQLLLDVMYTDDWQASSTPAFASALCAVVGCETSQVKVIAVRPGLLVDFVIEGLTQAEHEAILRQWDESSMASELNVRHIHATSAHLHRPLAFVSALAMEEAHMHKQALRTRVLNGESVDAHGCVLASFYTWCPESQQCVQNWVGGVDGPCTKPASQRPMCLESEGFSWCERSQRCVQDWVGGIDGPCKLQNQEEIRAIAKSTCMGRCGKNNTVTQSCNCDGYCEFYGDCCDDYDLFCTEPMGQMYSKWYAEKFHDHDRDEHGCNSPGGFSWCPSKEKCVQDWVGGAYGPCSDTHSATRVNARTVSEYIVGGERDSYGCLSRAGFSWCEPTLKCVQDWQGGLDGPCPRQDEDHFVDGDFPVTINGRIFGGARDSFGCLYMAGFSYCKVKNRCVQDWDGGIDGPCQQNATSDVNECTSEVGGEWSDDILAETRCGMQSSQQCRDVCSAAAGCTAWTSFNDGCCVLHYSSNLVLRVDPNQLHRVAGTPCWQPAVTGMLRDSQGCYRSAGFSYCALNSRCVQDWVGGIDGPCSRWGTDSSPPLTTVKHVTVRATLRLGTSDPIFELVGYGTCSNHTSVTWKSLESHGAKTTSECQEECMADTRCKSFSVINRGSYMECFWSNSEARKVLTGSDGVCYKKSFANPPAFDASIFAVATSRMVGVKPSAIQSSHVASTGLLDVDILVQDQSRVLETVTSLTEIIEQGRLRRQLEIQGIPAVALELVSVDTVDREVGVASCPIGAIEHPSGSGKCQHLPCPSHSYTDSDGSCVCVPGTEGSLVWTQNHWEGECLLPGSLCHTSHGYSWCDEQNQCVQDWVGGINGPCVRDEVESTDLLPIKVGGQIVGGVRDSRKCLNSGGYSWCDQKRQCVQDWVGGDKGPCSTLAGYAPDLLNQIITVDGVLVGGHRDSHDCMVSANFTWCEERQECVQNWHGGVNGPCNDKPVDTDLAKFPRIVNGRLMGGRRDKHGCCTGCKFTFCEAKQKCVQNWVGGIDGPCGLPFAITSNNPADPFAPVAHTDHVCVGRSQGFTWCEQKKLCVQNWIGGQDGPCFISGGRVPTPNSAVAQCNMLNQNTTTCEQLQQRVLAAVPHGCSLTLREGCFGHIPDYMAPYLTLSHLCPSLCEGVVRYNIPDVPARLLPFYNPDTVAAEDATCNSALGFSWCDVQERCVQDWAGGIDGPCIAIPNRDLTENILMIAVHFPEVEGIELESDLARDTLLMEIAEQLEVSKGLLFNLQITSGRFDVVLDMHELKNTVLPEAMVQRVGDMVSSGKLISGLAAHDIRITEFFFPRLPVFIPSAPRLVDGVIVGGQRDHYGCLATAGFTWCADRGMCVQDWEMSMTGPCHPERTRQSRPTPTPAGETLEDADEEGMGPVDVTLGSAAYDDLTPTTPVYFNFKLQLAAVKFPFALANLTLENCGLPVFTSSGNGTYTLRCLPTHGVPAVMVRHNVAQEGVVTIVDSCEDDVSVDCAFLRANLFYSNNSYIPATSSLANNMSECSRNAAFMKQHCPKSCGLCHLRNVTQFNFQILPSSTRAHQPFSLANLTLTNCSSPNFRRMKANHYSLTCAKNSGGRPFVALNPVVRYDPWKFCPSTKRCETRKTRTFSVANMLCCGTDDVCDQTLGQCVHHHTSNDPVDIGPIILPDADGTVVFNCTSGAGCEWSAYSHSDRFTPSDSSSFGNSTRCEELCRSHEGCTGYEVGSSWCSLWLYGACNTVSETIPLGFETGQNWMTCTRSDIAELPYVVCPRGTHKANGSCEMVECPHHSNGYPHCECMSGYDGAITWSFLSSSWDGECVIKPPLSIEISPQDVMSQCTLPGLCTFHVRPNRQEGSIPFTLTFSGNCAGLQDVTKVSDAVNRLGEEFMVEFPRQEHSYSCNVTGTAPGYHSSSVVSVNVAGVANRQAVECSDNRTECQYWSSHLYVPGVGYMDSLTVENQSECDRVPDFMTRECKKSCGVCETASCVGEETFFAGYGFCQTYGKENSHECMNDYDSILRTFAFESCPQCAKCESVSASTANETSLDSHKQPDAVAINITEAYDEHGCMRKAGFTYCETMAQCMQDWEGGIDGPCPHDRSVKRNMSVVQCHPFADNYVKSCDELKPLLFSGSCNLTLSTVCKGSIPHPYGPDSQVHELCPLQCQLPTQTRALDEDGCNHGQGFFWCAMTARCVQSHRPGIGACEDTSSSTIMSFAMALPEVLYTTAFMSTYSEGLQGLLTNLLHLPEPYVNDEKLSHLLVADALPMAANNTGVYVEITISRPELSMEERSHMLTVYSELLHHMLYTGSLVSGMRDVGLLSPVEITRPVAFVPTSLLDQLMLVVSIEGISGEQLASSDVHEAVVEALEAQIIVLPGSVSSDSVVHASFVEVTFKFNVGSVSRAQHVTTKMSDVLMGDHLRSAINMRLADIDASLQITSVTVLEINNRQSAPRYIGQTIVGGERDENNCAVTAGFEFCEVEGACVQNWDTGIDGPCLVNGTNSTVQPSTALQSSVIPMASVTLDLTTSQFTSDHEWRAEHEESLVSTIETVLRIPQDQVLLQTDGSVSFTPQVVVVSVRATQPDKLIAVYKISVVVEIIPAKDSNLYLSSQAALAHLSTAIEQGVLVQTLQSKDVRVTSVEVAQSTVAEKEITVSLLCPADHLDSCFDADFTCESCCTVGVAVSGLSCWDSIDFSFQKCCRVAAAPISTPTVDATATDTHDCDSLNGFTFCVNLQKCVQDWPGGIDGPCPSVDEESSHSKPSPTATPNATKEAIDTRRVVNFVIVVAFDASQNATEFMNNSTTPFILAVAQTLGIHTHEVRVNSAMLAETGEMSVHVTVKLPLLSTETELETALEGVMSVNTTGTFARFLADNGLPVKSSHAGTIHINEPDDVPSATPRPLECSLANSSDIQSHPDGPCHPGTHSILPGNKCITQCADGYQPDVALLTCSSTGHFSPKTFNCLPVCRSGCFHGTCVAPGICVCTPGFAGSLCDTEASFIGYSLEIGLPYDPQFDKNHNEAFSEAIAQAIGLPAVDEAINESRVRVTHVHPSSDRDTLVQFEIAVFGHREHADTISKTFVQALRNGIVADEIRSKIAPEVKTLTVSLVNLALPKTNTLTYVGGDAILEILGDHVHTVRLWQFDRRAMTHECNPITTPPSTQYELFRANYDKFVYIGGKRVLAVDSSNGTFSIYHCASFPQANGKSSLDCNVISSGYHQAFEDTANMALTYLEPHKVVVYDALSGDYSIFLIHKAMQDVVQESSHHNQVIETVPLSKGSLYEFCRVTPMNARPGVDLYSVTSNGQDHITLLCAGKAYYRVLRYATSEPSADYPAFLTTREISREKLSNGHAMHGSVQIDLEGGFLMSYVPRTLEYSVIDCTSTSTSDCAVIASSTLKKLPSCYGLSHVNCTSNRLCGWCHSTQQCMQGHAEQPCGSVCPQWEYGTRTVMLNPRSQPVPRGFHNLGSDADVSLLRDDTFVKYNSTGEVGLVKLTVTPTSVDLLTVWKGKVPFENYVALPFVNGSVLLVDHSTGIYAVWQCHRLRAFTFIGESSGCSVIKTGHADELIGFNRVSSLANGNTLMVLNETTTQVSFYTINPLDNSTTPLIAPTPLTQQIMPSLRHSLLVAIANGYILSYRPLSGNYEVWLHSQELGLTGPFGAGVISLPSDVGHQTDEDSQIRVVFAGDDRLMILSGEHSYLLRVDYSMIWNLEALGLSVVGVTTTL